jgi:hypothetical protein
MVGENMLESIRRMMLNRIEEKGRKEGAPIVNFLEREISVEGEDMYVGQNGLEWLLYVSAFYLSLPPNTYGVVVYPDGTSHELAGKLHEVPAGVYQVHYVDKHERTDTSAPVSEITTDGEKLILQVILRYHVTDPVLALRIVQPVETLMEHIETDVAQYIRTHAHGDIADSANGHDNKLFSFFSEKHNRRQPLSDAIAITGMELKDFTEDREYVEMRRMARMNEKQNQIERQQAEYQQELNRLKAQHKVDNKKLAAELQVKHEKEKLEILHESQVSGIELDKKVSEREVSLSKGVSETIFISYRRTDSADISGRIYDRLVGRFGKAAIFKDVDSIPLGVDFKENLEKKVSECNILLAIIGDRWLEASDSVGRNRLDDPRDFVRIEIETALARNIPVIPLLVRGAVIPAEEKLPISLKKLFYQNGIQIRPDPDFHRDMERLIFYLEKYLQ